MLRFWRLRWRSTRDGATAEAFHRLCDHQGPTLTLVLDTTGNVFGGYTAVDWHAGTPGSCYRKDPTAFLFSAVNPYGDPPLLFSCKFDRAAVYCHVLRGPNFYGLGVFTDAVDGDCVSDLGPIYSYTNTTRHAGDQVLTGARRYTPAEVEVWSLE